MEMETSASELITIVAEAVIIAKAEVKAKYAPLVEACDRVVDGTVAPNPDQFNEDWDAMVDALKAVTNE